MNDVDVATLEEAALTLPEEQRLRELEEVVERGLQTFVEVGNALTEIRDSRLYRESHATFEEYCKDRWGMSKTNANRLIAASGVMGNLTPIGVIPQNEAQARPLASLDPDSQREAWQRAVRTAPNGKITGAHVERTVGEMTKPAPAPDRRPQPPRGYEPWDGKKCPICHRVGGRKWGASQWQDEEVTELKAKIEVLDNAWLQGDQKELRPGMFSPEALTLRDHWSRYATGSCDCGALFWHDYIGEWNHFYLPGSGTNVEQETYVPIWKLEQGVRAHLDAIEGLLNRPVPVHERIEMLESMKELGYSTLLSSGLVPGPRRKSDVRQAANNVLEQLRQEVRQPAVEVSADTSSARPLDVLHSSETNEWYTPAQYVEAARKVMLAIDMDPASCAFANRVVQADTFYSVEEDGLAQEWRGRIFLNPPYGKDGNESSQAVWSERLIAEYQAGNITEAILLVNAVPGNRWWAPLWDYPVCFPDHRIRFYNGDGTPRQPPHSSAFVYLGPNKGRFAEVFTVFGPVVTEVAR